ncbi:hypothetical protein NMY22_g5026 [Coprinellus aureogranulatus]|nr:hypothetical protein NMY22_g5026 [Coprinellus aureogranulatus]
MAHPVIWSSKSFFYPIGNTPATSLTEHIPPEEDATVLVLGCGDPRNALYTIDAEDKHPLKRNLDITFCDMEPGVLARNIVIYTLLLDGCDDDTIEKIWKIYLDVFIDQGAADLIVSQCKKLLELTSDTERWRTHSYGQIIKFCTADTIATLRRFWDMYIAPDRDMKQMKPQVLKDMHDTYRRRTQGTEVATGIRSAGIMAMDAAPFVMDHFKHYWKCGVTDTDPKSIQQATHVNPTLLFSSSGLSFNLHYGTDPIMCFHLAPALATVENTSTPAKTIGAIVTLLKSQFANWCHSFHRRSNAKPTSKGELKLRFFVGNAMSLCKAILSVSQGGGLSTAEYTGAWGAATITFLGDYVPSSPIPAPLSFNVIETSNLTDHLGFLNLLLIAAPLLKRDAASVLFTHSLVASKRIGHQYMSALDDIEVDLPFLSLLLGLVPERKTSEFTSYCMSHEIMLSGLTDSYQFLELNAWRVAAPTEPAKRHTFQADPSDLAKSLFSTYLKLYPDEGMAAMGGFLGGGKVPLKHYVRDSFVYFLTLVKSTYVGEWDAVMGRLIHLIETDRTLVAGLNNYQDLARGLHLAGLCDIMPDPSSFPHPTHDFLLRGWKVIPNAVFVVLVIPRAKIQDLIDDTVNSKDIRTPCLQCEILCPAGQNAFSTFQLTFGRIDRTGASASRSVVIHEDSAGWAGNSDLILHFPAPAWILAKWPADQYCVSLAMFPNMASAGYYSMKLGVNLTIYSTTLADSERAFMLRDRPRASSQPISQHGNLSTSPVDPTDAGTADRQVVILGFKDAKPSSFTIRCCITDDAAKTTLAEKTTQVNAKPLSISAVKVSFRGFESTLHFPYPINGAALKTRIARKSSYVEIEAPVAQSARVSVKLDPFPIVRTRNGALWQSRMHYLLLNVLPALRSRINAKTKSQWLRPHLGISLNEEKELEEASGRPKSGLSELKDSLSHILIRFLEDAESKPTIFKLTLPSSVGTYALLFVSSMRIDLTGHTIVADACILTLTYATMDNPSLSRALSGLVGQVIFSIDVMTPEEEVKWWKLYLPSSVERCRTWSHGKNCEYVSDGVPRSLEMGTDPICSCGQGKDLGGFADVKQWAAFKPFVTRVALGMPFPMSLLGGTASKLGAFMDKTGSPSDETQGRDVCMACGQGGKPKLLVCSACKSARYCSSACQKGHWKKHKSGCSGRK